MTDLIERLKSFGRDQWRPRSPGEMGAIAEAESEFGARLPDDHRALLLYSDGGSLTGPSMQMNLDSTDQLWAHNMDERFEDGIPGFFVIGDDGGGNVFAYDPAAKLGCGEYALFLFPLSALDIESAWFVGRNLTEAMTGIMDGENYRRRKRLGDP